MMLILLGIIAIACLPFAFGVVVGTGVTVVNAVDSLTGPKKTAGPSAYGLSKNNATQPNVDSVKALQTLNTPRIIGLCLLGPLGWLALYNLKKKGT